MKQIISNGQIICQLNQKNKKTKKLKTQKVETHKICTKCGVRKLLDNFYNDTRAKDGKQSQCRLCVLEERITKKFIYFIHDIDVNRVKIGYTSNLHNRAHELLFGASVCTKRKLLYIIPGNLAKETILHDMFKENQWNKKEIGSREWFNNTDNVIIDFIKSLNEKNKDSITSKKIKYGWSLLSEKMKEDSVFLL